MNTLRKVYAALTLLAGVGAVGFAVAMYLGSLAKAEVVDALGARMVRSEEDQKATDTHLSAVDRELLWMRQQLLEIARAVGARVVPTTATIEPKKGK